MTAQAAGVAPVAVAGVPAAARWRTTPGVLRALLGAIWVAAALLSLVGWRALVRAREAIQTVAHDTAPSIMAAQEVGAAFADLDAQAANELLVTDPAERDQAAQLFEYRRAQATKRLVDSARNITFGDAERVPIVLMFENLGSYIEAASRARQAAERGDMAAAVDAYRVATDIMHSRILVDAQALDDANHNVMEERYAEQQRAAAGMDDVAVACGTLLVLVLVGAQIFLFRRMRRMINVPLLIATVFAIAFTADLNRRIGDAREDLRVAKDDAFKSIHALWKMRARAYDANGDESRWLVDRAHAASWKTAFDASVSQLTDTPTEAALDAESAHLAGGKKTSMRGLFADEANNVTFAGELDAASAMIRKFGAYYSIDARIRQEEAAGHHAEAVRLCVHDSNDAFDAFDAAALRTLDLNQNVFDRVVADGEGALATAGWLDPVLAIVVALAGFLGIRPRLREYTS